MKNKEKEQSEVKEWRKTIEGEIKHHVLLIVIIALAILAGVALLSNYLSTKALLNEASKEMNQEAVQSVYQHFLIILLLSAVAIVVVVVVLSIIYIKLVRKLAKALGDAVSLCTERLQLLSKGDFHTPVPKIERYDEIGELARTTEDIVTTVGTIIKDIHYVMDAMGDGNFTVRTKARECFIGDYSNILDSERKIAQKLSETVLGIQSAAEQVTAGSTQLSESAQSLAEGATDQASSVEELLATVTDVTERVVQNAEEAAAVGKNAERMGEEAKESTQQMERMREAMERISEKSSQISGVIQSIEEIADQTDLLALNASIEAARAGESGKGFVVVANEISNLARQSGEAVENTRKLIEDSLREVESGHEIVNLTGQTLSELINGLNAIVKEIEKVSKGSGQQAEMIKQINSGIEQISAVVEENSASAQECSATSEELSAQAIQMNEMMEKFEIRRD